MSSKTKTLLSLILLLSIAFTIKVKASFVEPHIYSMLTSSFDGQGTLGTLLVNTGGAIYGLIVQSGLVGIGEDFPKAALDVNSLNNGFVPPRMSQAERGAILSPQEGLLVYNTDTKKFNFFSGTEWENLNEGDSASINTISYFDLSTCPSGWEEVPTAKGRYLTGTQNSGNRSAVVGQALGDGENRATGAHNHPVNDPGHVHDYYSAGRDTSRGQGWDKSYVAAGNTSRSTTGITISNPSGSVGGTNAPYIEFLVCRKVKD